MHEVLVNRFGGLSLPRKSVVRLTDRPDMTLDVYRGRKTTMQQQQLYKNIYCYPVLEPSHGYCSDEGSQHIFPLRNKEKSIFKLISKQYLICGTLIDTLISPGKENSS